MFENINLVLLVLSCAVSFGLGRLFLHFRNKKRRAAAFESAALAEQARRSLPPEPPSKNRAKRKRQMAQQGKDAGV
jgi:hypothetical protein